MNTIAMTTTLKERDLLTLEQIHSLASGITIAGQGLFSPRDSAAHADLCLPVLDKHLSTVQHPLGKILLDGLHKAVTLRRDGATDDDIFGAWSEVGMAINDSGLTRDAMNIMSLDQYLRYDLVYYRHLHSELHRDCPQ